MSSNNQPQNNNHSETKPEDTTAGKEDGSVDEGIHPESEIKPNEETSSEKPPVSEMPDALSGKEFIGQSEQVYQKFSKMLSRFYNLIFKQWRIKDEKNTDRAIEKVKEQYGITDKPVDENKNITNK